MNRLFLNVGYELNEVQLRACFSKFGVVSDIYLPKHTSGRIKGFGFATFATEEAMLLALQTPQHLVDGVLVQVKRAGPRPADSEKESQPAAVTSSHIFGRGPRLYVGGVADAVSEEKVRQHFGRWGNVTDVYFPGVKGQKRPNYCFVTFENYRSSQRACDQSDRQIDGWPIESISIAEDRKEDVSQPAQEASLPPFSGVDASATSPAVQHLAQLSNAAGLPGYALWLQLQYQQALGKLPTNEQVLPPFPLDPSQIELGASQRSSSIQSTVGSYPEVASAVTQNPITSTVPQSAQDSVPMWGSLANASTAAGQSQGFAPMFQGVNMYGQGTVMGNRPHPSASQQLNNMTFGQSSLTGIPELGVIPGWGMNYGVPPTLYQGGFPTDMYHTAPAPLTPGRFLYP